MKHVVTPLGTWTTSWPIPLGWASSTCLANHLRTFRAHGRTKKLGPGYSIWRRIGSTFRSLRNLQLCTLFRSITPLTFPKQPISSVCIWDNIRTNIKKFTNIGEDRKKTYLKTDSIATLESSCFNFNSIWFLILKQTRSPYHKHTLPAQRRSIKTDKTEQGRMEMRGMGNHQKFGMLQKLYYLRKEIDCFRMLFAYYLSNLCKYHGMNLNGNFKQYVNGPKRNI